MKLILRLTLFFFFAGNFLPAQVVLHTSGDTAKKKTNIKVSVLNPHGKTATPYYGHSMHSDSVQQALKINFVNFAHGDFSVYYEYRLSDAFSVEGGAGITYIDYLYEMFTNGGRFISRMNDANSAKFYSGYSGRFQIRWYPSKYETAITGYYFAPDISYRSYKMDYFVNTGLINEPHSVNRKYTDLKLQFGHQSADPYDRYFWEWFLSIGSRHVNEDYVEKTGMDAAFSNSKYWKPVIGAGIKIGFNL